MERRSCWEKCESNSGCIWSSRGEFLKKYKVVTTISYPKKGAMGKTGNWRVFRPILDKKNCVKCLRCWIFCPEATIKRNRDNSIDIDYEYCKGCGICANVCKIKAITMEMEKKKKWIWWLTLEIILQLRLQLWQNPM